MRVHVAHWVTHDGRKHGPGTVIDVPDEKAKMLIHDGLVRATEDDASPPAADEAPARPPRGARARPVAKEDSDAKGEPGDGEGGDAAAAESG